VRIALHCNQFECLLNWVRITLLSGMVGNQYKFTHMLFR
jgi:hypothetical protein